MVAPLTFHRASELAGKAQPITWLWRPLVAHGAVTLLTSEWKAGKTTLLAALLARLGDGVELVGRPVAKGRAVVLSEEGEAIWAPRQALFGIPDCVSFCCRPYRGRATEPLWYETIKNLLDLPPGLVVFDSLTEFLPPNAENNAGALRRQLSALHHLTRRGWAVLLTHHPNKRGGPQLAGRRERQE